VSPPDAPSDLTQSQYALLAVLSVEPMSGYDIRGFLESIGGFWSESYGQIYPNLRVLHRLGFVSKESGKGRGRRKRNVYSLTAEGRRHLRRWLMEPVWLDRPPRNELLLKLFFGPEIGPKASMKQIERYRRFLDGLRTQYLEIEAWLIREQADHPHLPYWLMTVRYGIGSVDALLAWCDESLQVLRRIAATTAATHSY
jgi:PadR family transcriptional regulator AphA